MIRRIGYGCVVESMALKVAYVRVVAFGYLVVLAFLSLNPWLRPAAEGNSDKIEHAIAYAGLTVLMFMCVGGARAWQARRPWLHVIAVMTISMAIGAALEVAQSLFTHNRVGSVSDAVANGVGVTLGATLFALAGWAYAKWRA